MCTVTNRFVCLFVVSSEKHSDKNRFGVYTSVKIASLSAPIPPVLNEAFTDIRSIVFYLNEFLSCTEAFELYIELAPVMLIVLLQIQRHQCVNGVNVALFYSRVYLPRNSAALLSSSSVNGRVHTRSSRSRNHRAGQIAVQQIFAFSILTTINELLFCVNYKYDRIIHSSGHESHCALVATVPVY